ncbi:MAG: RIP metalloprotease RseP [Verrucomicrobia bacterium]|nr:RIP metalloprotease RseP [Verrucomicrobiota bacterium]
MGKCLVSLLYLLLAILGLGFLIFIHELGHYWMARRVGMRVESFGIGFGRPIFSILHNGVKWNICWLPFGGYVKIAGMEKEDGKEPEDIPDGFFGKSPWDRIKVAIMGPLTNLVFAFLAFCVIWLAGGREKHFADVTNKIGSIDPQSELYKAGVRPGDIILKYNNEPVKGSKDHFQAAMISGDTIKVSGLRWDSQKAAYEPFTVQIHPYAHPQSLEPGILTTGVFSGANYVIYPATVNGQKNVLPAASPLIGSGIEPGDRILWVDGEPVYSMAQLSATLNDNKSLLTIERNGKSMLVRVPRVELEDLKLTNQIKEELTDWQYEGDLRGTKFAKLKFIAYNLAPNCVVEGPIPTFDATQAPELLLPGDVIVAIDGTAVFSTVEFLQNIQTHKVLIITEKMKAGDAKGSFDAEIHGKNLQEIVNSIGTSHQISKKGSLTLLKPIEPKTRMQLMQAEDKQLLAKEQEEEKKLIQAIDDPEKRNIAIAFLETRQKQLLLGLPNVEDLRVTYNPTPFQMFGDIVDEVVHTLQALVGGYLNPKWLSGPIGIVQVIHVQWMSGVKEALFWLGAISLNLGLLNLLPLPVLDGGYICLSLFEIVTGKRLKAKTIEKIVVPFAVALISFLLFLTYHDLIRLLTSFVK